MTTAFVFPGQGSQRPGMGEAFYDAWPEAREAFDSLDERSELPLAELCFGDDADRLRRTEYTQPAVYAVGIAVARAAVERYHLAPDLVAGHSLGHFTAAGHAGLYDPADGLELVTERGAAMERAGQTDGPGRMVAVLLADPSTVRGACEAVEGASVAAYNTARQTVVSGHDSAVAEVEERIEERTRARFTELDVGAAFHSPVMERAVEPVGDTVAATHMREADVPIVSDVTGRAYTDPGQAREDLRAQVHSPVDWVGVVETLRERGVDRVVEVPPAGTLSRFVDRTYGDATVVSLETPGDAEVFA